MMDLQFDETLAASYHSGTQKIRVMSEGWAAKNMFCPCCGNPHIQRRQNNEPVADFQCVACGAVFELKSKKGALGNKIADGAYGTMIERITGVRNPNLLVMTYSPNLSVTDMLMIPKFFFVPSVIEKRKPLAATARRAGWIGCDILIRDIPAQGKISMIENGKVADIGKVVQTYQSIEKLKTDNMESRGWLFDVLHCVNAMPTAEFTLQEIYAYSDRLKEKHFRNHNVEAKIRQQLQILREKGFIEFLGRGHYRKIFS